MPDRQASSFSTAEMVANDCLCLRVQRASRTIGRRFDEAFRPLGLNNWQFSMLMMLNRPSPLTVGELAEQLAMDRTTTSSNLKPLERKGFIKVMPDDFDARVRRVVLTKTGSVLLSKAFKHWQVINNQVKDELGDVDVNTLRSALDTIAAV